MRAIKNSITQVFAILIVSGLIAQESQGVPVYTKEQVEKIVSQKDSYADWIESLQEPGVKVEGDKMIFSKEAQKLMNDESYRASVYKSYTFEDVRESIAKNEIQKSFWQMIYLYPDHKEAVLQYIYAYDKAVPSDKIVSAAFYTYAFFDPSITNIKEGKPEVMRPDIFEEYLRRTQEIIKYIEYFRTEQKKIKS
ncbi:MAG: hypothetical protein Aureis2KO_02470 [Aureisphaera sp.]